MQGAVHGPAPRSPEGALGAGNFHRLMMFESCKRLRYDRVRAARKMYDRGEVVLELFVPRLPRAGRGINGLRIAERAEIPAGQIEEMNWLFKNPPPRLGNGVPPAFGAETIRASGQFNERVFRFANKARCD